jgi:branched-chain amino acid transport system permease protein
MAQHLLNALILGSIYLLFALGLTLSWGVLDIMNLAHGAVFMFGGFTAYVITDAAAVSFPIVFVAAVVVGAALSLAMDLVAYRPLRRRLAVGQGEAGRSKAELGTLIASVGMASILLAIAGEVTKNATVGIREGTLPVHVYHVAGLRITNVQLIILVVALVGSIALALFVQRSRHGRALRALAYDAWTTGLLGASPGRLASVTMLVAGGFAAGAGVLYATSLNFVDAQMGEPLLLKAFAIIILGGVGSVWGTMAGAYLLAIGETATGVYVSGDLQSGVAFLLILVLLVARPQGLFPRAAWQRA